MDTNTSRMINLDGSNYQLWKTRMEDLLYVNELHQPVICSEKPDGKTDEDWNLLHRRVCAYIRQWVDDSVLNHVSGETNARTLWSKLGKLYAPKSCDSKLFLIKQLISMKYHDGTSMSDHLNIFQGIINQLDEKGIKVDEEVQVLWFLATLPDSWETLKTSVLKSTPDGVVSLEVAKVDVLNEEMRRKFEGSGLCSNTPLVGEAHQHKVIKVAVDVNLHEQIGKHIYFDLVDHDKVHSFLIQKHYSFAIFKMEVSKAWGIPVEHQRFWFWSKRQNQTYRPVRPMTRLEEALPIGLLGGASDKANSAELNLYLEVDYGPESRPLSLPQITKKDILLFFKLYDPSKEELRYVGRLLVDGTSKPREMLTKLNKLAGFAAGEEIELFEEVKFEPSVMCVSVDKELSLFASELEDGDIICFQKLLKAGAHKYRYPNVPSFLKHVRNRQN